MGAFDADEKDSTFTVVFKLVGGIAMTLAAPFIAYYMIKLVITARASQSWPQTQATIIRFDVEQFDRKGVAFYRPRVEYLFTVDGKPFTGTRLSFVSNDAPSRSAFGDLAVKYAVQTQHPVYYDAADPTQSTLDRSNSGMVYLGFLFPVVFGLLGPFMIKEQSQMLRGRLQKKKPMKSKPGNKPRRRRPLPPPEE
jgi:hypothetical protein